MDVCSMTPGGESLMTSVFATCNQVNSKDQEYSYKTNLSSAWSKQKRDLGPLSSPRI